MKKKRKNQEGIYIWKFKKKKEEREEEKRREKKKLKRKKETCVLESGF